MTTNERGVRSGAKGGQSVARENQNQKKKRFSRNLFHETDSGRLGTTEDDRRTRHRRLFRSLGTNARVEAPRARRGTHLPVLVVRPVLLRRSNPTHVRRGRGRGAHPATPSAYARATGRANKCRFLGPNGNEGLVATRRAEGGAEGARRTPCVRAGAAVGRDRAASRARSGDTRDRRDRAVCGVRDMPLAFSLRERPPCRELEPKKNTSRQFGSSSVFGLASLLPRESAIFFADGRSSRSLRLDSLPNQIANQISSPHQTQNDGLIPSTIRANVLLAPAKGELHSQSSPARAPERDAPDIVRAK